MLTYTLLLYLQGISIVQIPDLMQIHNHHARGNQSLFNGKGGPPREKRLQLL